MVEFDRIYLSWRPGQGKRRYIVGVLEKHSDHSYTFKYDLDAVKKAEEEGFLPYTEFPDTARIYNGNVLDIFTQRLTKADRGDIQSFYDFWEIEPSDINDKFYLLGHTQGLLPTDNFEFLADYKPVAGLHFLTDIAFVPGNNLQAGSVVVGDNLEYRREENNQYYKYAVKVYKGNLELGYIKKIHSKLLFEFPGKFNLTVKAIDQNGLIKRIFVKIWR